MGLFDAFKKGSKEAEQEVLEKFWTLTERFSKTLRMSSVLLEGNLSSAGFDAKQKATFNAAILLGLLEGIEKIVNDKHITQKIVLGELHQSLKELFDLDHDTANEVVHMVQSKNAKDASFVALRKFGKERVVIFFSDQSDPDLMKSLALDVVYENESLLNNFKKEYKPLR